jgi:uncharacterized protein involved in type VI secretion and phage assembly
MIPAWKQLGLMIGIVSNRRDPDGLGRVKVRYPTLKDSERPAQEGIESDWARVLAPYGGKDHGLQAVPEVGDEVVVGFMEGDPKVPLIIGSVYSRKNMPPSREVDERIFKSRNGHTIVVSDHAGKERIELQTKSGQRITIDEVAKTITVEARQISLGKLATQPAVHGVVLETILSTLLRVLGAHTHVTPAGPSLPSVELATTTTALTTQMAALLSKKVRVE